MHVFGISCFGYESPDYSTEGTEDWIASVETCGDCDEMNTCEKPAMITGNNEEALKRLKG